MRQGLTETLAAIIHEADAQSRQLNQEFVGAEHLFAAILRHGSGEGWHVLRGAVDVEQLHGKLLKALPHGDVAPVVSGRLPLSPKAQAAINDAMTGSQASPQTNVSSRFLVFALLEESDSMMVQLLQREGADLDDIRRQLQQTPRHPES